MTTQTEQVAIDDPKLRRELKEFVDRVWNDDGPDFMGCNCCPIEMASILDMEVVDGNVPVNEEGEEDCSKCYNRKVEQFKDHIGDRVCDEYGSDMIPAIEDALKYVLDSFKG